MTSGPSIRTLTRSPAVGPTGLCDSQPISVIINMGISPGTALEPRIVPSICPITACAVRECGRFGCGRAGVIGFTAGLSRRIARVP
jgi:hypothetical protein